MLLTRFILCAALVSAADLGFWVANYGEVFYQVQVALGLYDDLVLRELNDLSDLSYVRPGSTYTVPFTSLNSPATWEITQGSAFLHLSDISPTPTTTSSAAPSTPVLDHWTSQYSAATEEKVHPTPLSDLKSTTEIYMATPIVSPIVSPEVTTSTTSSHSYTPHRDNWTDDSACR